MKQLFFALLAACLLASCTPKSTPTADAPISSDSLKTAFFAVSKGVWVSTRYIQEIVKTESPLQAAGKLEGVVAMIVPEKSQGDSVEIQASWNNHEGYSFLIYFQPGEQPNRLVTTMRDANHAADIFEVGYETEDGETHINVYRYDKRQGLVDAQEFTKVADAAPDNDVTWGLQAIVNEKLIAGSYTVYDSTKNMGFLKFNREGTCAGYGDFKSFYLFTDFLGGPMPAFDEIAFNLGTETDRRYAIDRQGDTLLLSNLVGVEEEGSLKRDKVRLTLVRE
jgi:hypothetical protein